MKKNKKTPKKIVKEETADEIVPYWVIRAGWEELSDEKKAEYYWKYQYVNGVRVFDHD